MGAWTRARAALPEGAEAFIREREWRCCFYASRLSSSLGSRPRKGDGHAAFMKGTGIDSVALLGGEGTLMPVGGGLGIDEPEGLADILERERFKAGRIVGSKEDVEALERVLGEPRDAIDYVIMTSGEGAELKPLPGGVSMRRAEADDFEELLPLQEAYEREEVLIPIHAFDRRALEAGLRESLARHIVLVAESGGAIIGKAQTNARGFLWDQLGGIFVAKEWRGRGIGAGMAGLLSEWIGGAGRRTCLFARSANAPALRAYARAGFKAAGGYRIAYYA